MTWKPKRFYRSAEVVCEDKGYRVILDSRTVKTPAGADLVLPTRPLAQAVAEEWLAQDDTVRPQTMPTTRLAATAVDRVGPERQAVIERMLAYGGTELLCYRAEAPGELAGRQHRCWQPLLDWAADRWGAELCVTHGVMPVQQPAKAIEALRDAVAALDDVELTALASAVHACGSLVVGLALVLGRIDAGAAFEAAQLDESYQIERWGEDDELSERRRQLWDEIHGARTFLDLVRSDVAG